MRRLHALILLSSAAGLAAAADPPRPRGVGPEFAKFYKAADKFACISNPTIVLSLDQVNDDYCDCPDGSDEPGTSACSHVFPLSQNDSQQAVISLPGFYCKNKGHNPGYIPFTNVNDGVCDYELCCDGSDEWDGAGGVTCENRCKEIGKEWRALDNARKKAMGAALKRRKEMVLEATTKRQEVESRIAQLSTEVKSADQRVLVLEKELADVEIKEKGKVVKGSPGGSRVNVLAGIAKDRIEELRTNLLSVRSQRDIYHNKLKQLEEILTNFRVDYNPNFNDEGVKRAVKAWDDYSAGKESGATVGVDDNAAEERDLNEILKPDGQDQGINWAEWEGGEEDDVGVLYQFEAYLPPSLRHWLDQKLRSLRVMLIENGILADNGNGAESYLVSAARNALEAAQTDRDNKQKDLTAQNEDLARDHGPSDIFRALKGHCVKTDSGEYTYELCWMDKTMQIPQKGGGGTNLGNFVRFDKVVVDEDVPADGKGLGIGERLALLYEGGQHCWNGPSRSTTVVLGCAEKEEIWRVAEVEKCVYKMEVGTPAACEGSEKEKVSGKDEL